MEKKLILSCEAGDPANESTWSGTPYKLMQCLQQSGVTVAPINSNLTPFQGRSSRILQKIWAKSILLPQSRFEKRLRSKNFIHQARPLNIDKVLHLCTGDMLLVADDTKRSHYILFDTTWDLWRKFVSDKGRYSAAFVRRVDERERYIILHAAHIFSISEYVKRNLTEHYGVPAERITVVGTGRGNIRPFFGNKDVSQKTILFAAKDRFADKGGILLLEGYKIAQKKNPDLKLVIVGSDHLKQYCGDCPHVTVTGYIPWAELENLFHQASLFAMPALHEPWGLVYLEALACKLPILGLNRNSLPEITQEGQFGYLVDVPAKEEIARAIEQAFSNPEEMRKKGEAGHRYCLQNYQWEQTAQKIMSKIFAS